MTSKISFSKLIKEDIKKRAWLLLLSITIFIIIIPVLTAIKIEGALPGGVSSSSETWREVQTWFLSEMGFSNIYMWSAIILGGVLSGITSFSYLHSKNQIDFYHSFPIKRETWYFVNYIGGVIQIVVPYIIGYILLLAIGIVKGVASPQLFHQSSVIMGMMVLVFLLVYGTTALAMIITGKLLVGILGTLIFFSWGSVIVALKNYIMLQIFENYMTEEMVTGFLENMKEGGGWYSPILMYDKIRQYYELGKPMFPLVMVLIFVIALIFLLGLFAFKKRKMENVGKAIVYSKLESIVQIVITVSAGVFFSVIVSSQNQTRGMKNGWLYGIAVVSVVIVYGIISFIYNGDVRILFEKKIPFFLSMGITLVVLTVFQFDILGYDEYVPEKDKIETMAIDSYDANYLLNYRGLWDNRSYKEHLVKLKTTQFEPMYSLIKDTLKEGSKPNAENTTVNIGYYLKNGRKIYRKYQVNREKLLLCLDRAMTDENYKREILKIGEIDADEKSSVSFENIRSENIPVKLNETERELLYDQYYKDMEKYPLSDILDGEIIGRLYYKSKKDERVLYVFKEYKDFISVLSQYCEVPDKITQQEVTSITVEDFRDSDNLKEITVQATEKEKIQSILDSLSYTEMGSYSGNIEPNVYVSIATEDDLISAFIKKGKIPEFLK